MICETSFEGPDLNQIIHDMGSDSSTLKHRIILQSMVLLILSFKKLISPTIMCFLKSLQALSKFKDGSIYLTFASG